MSGPHGASMRRRSSVVALGPFGATTRFEEQAFRPPLEAQGRSNR